MKTFKKYYKALAHALFRSLALNPRSLPSQVILVAASPYFRNILNQGLLNEKHFRLPDGIDGRIFRVLLDCAVGSCSPLAMCPSSPQFAQRPRRRNALCDT